MKLSLRFTALAINPNVFLGFWPPAAEFSGRAEEAMAERETETERPKMKWLCYSVWMYHTLLIVEFKRRLFITVDFE